MISTGRLDRWLRGLDRRAADLALLGAGVRWDDVGAARADQAIGLRPRIVRWSLTDDRAQHAFGGDALAVADAWSPAGPLRLAVETDAIAGEILRRLLGVPDIASAFIAVRRPAGSLRRRPWQWPLRVGVLGFPELSAEDLLREVAGRDAAVGRMLDLRRIEEEPSAVDVLVLRGPLDDAVAQMMRFKPVANAVAVLDAPLERSPLIEAQMATARACTAASVSATVAPLPLVDLLHGLVLHLSHAEPIDIALTRAGRQDVRMWAEPDALARSILPEIARHGAGEIAALDLTSAAPPAEILQTRDLLVAAADGSFLGESHEATAIAEANAAAEPALDALDQARWCQARVGDQGDNTLCHGANPVTFFIGPVEEDAFSPPAALDEAQLPWEDENASAFRLTVVFIPAVADPVPQQAELELPRFGRSADVGFSLDVPGHAAGAAARILVLFRNRVLQTAVLRGEVGAPAELAEVVGLMPSLAGLDERRAFDAAVFANHTGGRRQLSRHSDGQSFVSSAAGVPAIAERLAGVLAQAADRRTTRNGLRSEPARKLMVSLAVHGRDLFDSLETELGPLAGASRIQIVSARSDWLLPIELAYGRPAPDEDAAICDRYLEDPAGCDGECTGADDTSTLCPNAFWGLSRTIERHRFDPAVDADPGEGHLLVGLKHPRTGKRDLKITRALFGASSRVAAADNAATVAALGNAVAAAGWEEWKSSLTGEDTELLVLLPHTDYPKAELEIATKRLARGRIEPPYVTGGRGVNPIVVLFGCRTTGTGGDPAGFASRFMQKGARAVFHSSTDLLNVHASQLAQRLAARLITPGPRPQLLSDALVEFRREAVHGGMIVAMAISAFGDADWRI